VTPLALMQVARQPVTKKLPTRAEDMDSGRLEPLLFKAESGLGGGSDDNQSSSGDFVAPALADGFVVVRVPKTGSSTLQAVARRIGGLYGMTLLKGTDDLSDHLNETQPAPGMHADDRIVYTGHGIMRLVYDEINQIMPKSFKIAMVRDPAERCMSSFYHLFEGGTGTEGEHGALAKVKFMEGDCDFFEGTPELLDLACSKLRCPGYMTWYLEPYVDAPGKDLFTTFDFIGVTERFDESMLILKQMLGLRLSDVLYVKVKEGGGDAECATTVTAQNEAKVPLDEEPRPVQEAANVLRSSDVDMQLYGAANAALDAAIVRYGPSFKPELEVFRRWIAIADEECRCVHNSWDPTNVFICVSNLVMRNGWDKLGLELTGGLPDIPAPGWFP